MKLTLAFFILVPSLAWGAKLLAPDFSVRTEVRGSQLSVIANPPPNHEFNTKAPMYIECPNATDAAAANKKIQPTTANPLQVLFELPCPSVSKITVTLYLCDASKSFCEDHKVTVDWKKSQASGPIVKQTEEVEKMDKKPKIGTIDKDFGFFMNQPAEALSTAKANNMPLLIDFYAIWCPACNQLDDKVFPEKSFQKLSEGFVKLKLDADKETSWPLKSKYKIGGYPTIIFADPNGEEISRIVGFRKAVDLNLELKRAIENRENSFSKLKLLAKNGDKDARLSIANILIERKAYIEALKYLSKDSQFSKERKLWFIASIGFTQKQDDTKLTDLLKEALKQFPNALESIDWLSTLAEKTNDSKYFLKSISVAKKFIANPKLLKGEEMTVGDLYSSIASTYELLNKKKEAKDNWAKAAIAYKGLLKSSNERGLNMELAYCLWKSGQKKQAEKIYTIFERKYPNEFTFYFGHANMLLEQKDLPRALELSSRAYSHSYGDNRLRAAALKARILEAMDRKVEALEFLRQVIKGIVQPSDPDIRTHRYIKTLTDLEKKLKN